MPKQATVCLDPATRSHIDQVARTQGFDISGILQEIPDCGRTQRRSAGGKRAPSEYNLFIRDCFKTPGVQKLPFPQRMKQCAIQWKQRK